MFASLAVAVALAVAAAPSTSKSPSNAAPDRPRVLVLDLGGDVSESSRRAVTALVATGLQRRGLDVISGDDVRRLVELEANRQGMGCASDESCLTEIAGAMDARLVVTGFVGRLGNLTVVNLSLFDAREAKARGRASVEAEGVEALPKKLDPAIDEMVRDFLPKPSVPVLPLSLIGGGAGAVVVGAASCVAGAMLFFGYDGARGRLLDTSAKFEKDPDPDLIADIADGNRQVDGARQLWNFVGLPATWVGGALVVGGIGTAIAGGALLAQEGE